MNSSSPLRPARLVTAAAALLCGACANHTKNTAAPQTPDHRQVLTEGEYEYVRVTGSNIPVRVPKSPTARPLPSASPVTEISPEAFRDTVQRGLGSSRR